MARAGGRAGGDAGAGRGFAARQPTPRPLAFPGRPAWLHRYSEIAREVIFGASAAQRQSRARGGGVGESNIKIHQGITRPQGELSRSHRVIIMRPSSLPRTG